MTKPLLLLAFAVLLFGCQNDGSQPIAPTGPVSAEYAKVQAILDKNCIRCHAEDRGPRGIHLTSYGNVMAGSDKGPIVKAGDPENSLIVRALKGDGVRQMPPRGGPLPADQIQTVEDWVRSGAKS